MKKICLITIIIFLFVNSRITAQNIGISDVTHVPDTSAVLDVYSTSKGMLMPRVALTSTTDSITVTSPVSSLLLYNTATADDVTPGYYFWNGSNWVRLANGEGRLNNVTKTADATLTKTETMVLASNDITLTLPVVTSADDGLSVVIKNIGTYTDLITVMGNGAATIDSMMYTTLSRWRTRTFIASDGNWLIKDKEKCPENFLDISEMASWTSISEIIAFLNLHIAGPTVVRLDGGTYTISATQTINLLYPVTFEGLSYGESTIAGTAGVSGSPLFICETECYFKMLNFTAYANAAGNDAIHFTGSGKYHEVKNCSFSGFNKAIVSTNNSDLWIFETNFEGCTGAGIEIAAGSASGAFLKVSEDDFVQCAKGVSLLSGVAETVSIYNSTFYNTISGTDIGILYNSATFTTFISMFISGNSWNNQGTYVSGFDFARDDGRDANALLENNSGMEDKIPFCKINVTNNLDTTKIITNGVFKKAKFTNTSTFTCKWTLANNQITYQPANKRDVICYIACNVQVSNVNRDVDICIIKNGDIATKYGQMTCRAKESNVQYPVSTNVYIPGISPGDYLELWVTSSTSGDVIIVQDLSWMTNTQ